MNNQVKSKNGKVQLKKQTKTTKKCIKTQSQFKI